jgi:hypothetical protein
MRQLGRGRGEATSLAPSFRMRLGSSGLPRFVGASLVKVKNLVGTWGKVCACGSWLDHWRNAKQVPATDCANLACSNRPTVGGLVERARVAGPVLVVPLCNVCLRLTTEYEVLDAWTVAARTASCP